MERGDGIEPSYSNRLLDAFIKLPPQTHLDAIDTRSLVVVSDPIAFKSGCDYVRQRVISALGSLRPNSMEDLLKLHSILTNAYLASGMKQNDASAAALADLKSGSLTKEMKAGIFKADKVVR
jgi:hypothetical protein